MIKIIKKETEDRIVRLETTLKEVILKKTNFANPVEKLVDAAIDILKVMILYTSSLV